MSEEVLPIPQHLKTRKVGGKWSKYGRKYCKSWDKDPDLKAWIRPVPNSKEKAYCLFCRKYLRAHHGDLIQHLKTAKHQRNDVKFGTFMNPEPIDAPMVLALETASSDEPNTDVVVNLTNEVVADIKIDFIQFGILTISDRCFKSERIDESGDYLQGIISSNTLPFPGVVFVRQCVPDEVEAIESVLNDWSDVMQVDVIISTGGTGFMPRDVTPEATSNVIHKLTPAISTALTIASLEKTPMAMLSRGVAGIRSKTLIVNLPGSRKAVQQCFDALIPVLYHAVEQLKGLSSEVDKVHSEMEEPEYDPRYQGYRPAKSCTSAKETGEELEMEELPRELLVSRRLRKSPYPVVAVDYAVQIILKEAYILGIEMPDLYDCLGQYLVHDVISSVNIPPFQASIKDGYAVIADEGAGTRRVLGAMSAGASPDSLIVEPGTCVRISTGAPVPEGADAIVQVEDTQLVTESDFGGEELEINILRAPTAKQDIRPVGFDIKSGTVVLERHTYLSPTELALLASVGKSNPSVFKKPVVSVISTGSEIQTPSQFLKPGCIWDSNKFGLMGLLKQNGFVGLDKGIARDTIDSIKDRLKAAFQQSTVVITTGGVSMGEKDLLKYVLVHVFKARIHFAQVFMKPGKPSTFATVVFDGQKKLIFALPGNPASAMVTFNLLVLPGLRSMSGELNPISKPIEVRLGSHVTLDPRPEYQRVRLDWSKGGSPIAHNTGNQLSSRMASFFKADALAMLPARSPDQTIIDAGEMVQALLLN